MPRKKSTYEKQLDKELKKNPYRTENPEFAEAMREKGRSSATQPHVPKHLKGTRKNKQEKAIKDSLS